MARPCQNINTSKLTVLRKLLCNPTHASLCNGIMRNRKRRPIALAALASDLPVFLNRRHPDTTERESRIQTLNARAGHAGDSKSRAGQSAPDRGSAAREYDRVPDEAEAPRA